MLSVIRKPFAQIIKQYAKKHGDSCRDSEDSIGPLMNSPKIERTEMLVLSWNIKRTMSSWIWLQEEQADFMLLQEVSPKSVMIGNGSIIMGHDSDPSVAAVASYKHPIERWDIIPRITDPDLKRMMEYLESREKKFGDKEGTRGRLVGASSEVDGKKWILISFHAAPLKTPLDAQKVYLGVDPHQKELTKDILGPQIIEKHTTLFLGR